MKSPPLQARAPGEVKFDDDKKKARNKPDGTLAKKSPKVRERRKIGGSLPSKKRVERSAALAADGGPVLKYEELMAMQRRFESASDTIQSILARERRGGKEQGVEDGMEATATSDKIASQLSVWKDDVARLTHLVDTHINRCRRLQDHEEHMSHQSKDSPGDIRRKRVNEFVLSLKADLRALHAYISKRAVVEEFEAHSGEVHVIRPIDVHTTEYPKNTRSFWREKELALEKKLREIMPIEPEKAKSGGGAGREAEAKEDEKEEEKGSENGDEQDEEEKKEGVGDELVQRAIKAHQILELYELRQGLMYGILEHFTNLHSDIETEFDGGTESAVTSILRSDKDKREMGACVKSFLKVAENIEELGIEVTEKFGFVPHNIKEAYEESLKIDGLRKEVARIQYGIRTIEQKLELTKRQRNDYKNKEIRRGLLQRWRVQMDEHESALKVLLSREKAREATLDELEIEETKYGKSIEVVQQNAHAAADNHERNLRKIHPRVVEFIEDANRHKERLESLLLDVNLTTGLFKKREQKMSAVEQKINKTRSARAQIDMERRMSQLAFATLNVDSKRNAQVLDVALKANEVVREAYRKHSHALQENENEIENFKGQLKKAEKERGTYEERLREKKIALEEKIAEKELLSSECIRLNKVLEEVTKQCEEILEQFSDQKMVKLKEVIAELKKQEKANSNIRQALDKAKKKVEKLEGFLATTSSGSKMKGYLDEFT
eukprot:CAMPEP_0197562540 /NCGR_PEP_ID=MMETSP1320-20131121/27106_1 /TAXON_ID=91990 /ORGANISM="Bolidomonas sp., Strain RCC2347" /LENGTH=724 /DNA_ID=CAMNT_0043124283 /DNA_START=182 /DNA_END=2353 /DNA_ORIENTATION=-